MSGRGLGDADGLDCSFGIARGGCSPLCPFVFVERIPCMGRGWGGEGDGTAWQVGAAR